MVSFPSSPLHVSETDDDNGYVWSECKVLGATVYSLYPTGEETKPRGVK